MSTTPDPNPARKPRNEYDVQRFDYPWHDTEKVQRAYDEIGTVIGVADHFGIDQSTARRVLERYTDYEREKYGSTKLADLSPEQVGLSPLGSAKPDVGGDA